MAVKPNRQLSCSKKWLGVTQLRGIWSKVYSVFGDLRTCSDLLHILVEAKSSLYLCTQSSLKRDFTRLMWDDRWILGRDSDNQITGELRMKSFTGWVSSGQQLRGHVLTSQTCGFAHHYMPTLWCK